MDYNKDNYSIDDIYNLISNEVEENIHLDYKEARALGKEDPKKTEITKDVSAFANSDGGVIVYGISEASHKPKAISPIDGKTFTKEWLENVIQQIQPRIDGIKIFPIRVDGNIEKSIYVVQIPRSANAPHMAKDHRYYKRFNFESVPMEDYEVKDAYNRVTTPNLAVDSCTFYVEEEKNDQVTYHLSAAVLNKGNRACESYKLNFYINNAKLCGVSYRTLEERNNSFTIMDDKRFKMSSFAKAPIYPNEKLDMGNFQIKVKKQEETLFFENLVIEMMLFYTGGNENLAFIPITEEFIVGHDKIVQLVKERTL